MNWPRSALATPLPMPVRRSLMLSWVKAIATAETNAVFSFTQMAFAEGISRFWKTPVNDPWSPAPGPIFSVSPMPDTLLSPST